MAFQRSNLRAPAVVVGLIRRTGMSWLETTRARLPPLASSRYQINVHTVSVGHQRQIGSSSLPAGSRARGSGNRSGYRRPQLRSGIAVVTPTSAGRAGRGAVERRRRGRAFR